MNHLAEGLVGDHKDLAMKSLELSYARMEAEDAGQRLAKAKRSYRADPSPARELKMEIARSDFGIARRAWMKMVIMENAGL